MEEEIYRETYRAEAIELLDDLEAALLELESRPDDSETVNRIFRILHTIKGSGKMFGFDEIAAFSHDIETVYGEVRDGHLDASPELISLTLSAGDIIRKMVNDEPTDGEKHDSLMGQFRSILGDKAENLGDEAGNLGDKAGKKEQAPEPFQIWETVENHPAIYRIRFRPMPDIFKTGTNLLPLFDELREMGECTVVCHHLAVPTLGGFQPESCYLFWDIILTTRAGMNAIRDVFIFVEDECDLEIVVVADETEDSESHRRIGEILVEKGDLAQDELMGILNQRPLLGQALVQEKLVEPTSVEAALAEQRHMGQMRQEHQMTTQVNSLRVTAEKLDILVDLVGELIIAQARLSQHAATTRDAVAVNIAEDVERLTTALRTNTMSMRMLPIGTTFGKFKRLVRDLSKELGKQVEMVTEGGETELDKTVLDQLNDPLVHIIRNSIGHGIELPEKRGSLGKPSMGTIKFAAKHTGAHVIIRISDDGAGLDADRIRAAAISKCLVASDADLSEDEVFDLIFEPGFTTAAELSDVSGRGVGMDVVKRGVGSLRGTIGIQSENGCGTTITIRLPLTLAIIDGLLVKTGDEVHVIPQSAVRECFEQTREDMKQARGSNLIRVSGQMLPYICLRERFGIEGDSPASRRIVMCEANGREIGIAVDRIIGNYQTVIKPLGDVYKNIGYLSGATILGDGTVALILDPAKLMAAANAKTSC